MGGWWFRDLRNVRIAHVQLWLRGYWDAPLEGVLPVTPREIVVLKSGGTTVRLRALKNPIRECGPAAKNPVLEKAAAMSVEGFGGRTADSPDGHGEQRE